MNVDIAPPSGVRAGQPLSWRTCSGAGPSPSNMSSSRWSLRRHHRRW